MVEIDEKQLGITWWGNIRCRTVEDEVIIGINRRLRKKSALSVLLFEPFILGARSGYPEVSSRPELGGFAGFHRRLHPRARARARAHAKNTAAVINKPDQRGEAQSSRVREIPYRRSQSP